MNTEILILNTWTIGELVITKSCEVSALTGKRIPNSIVYSVDEFEGDNLNCFGTLAEAKKYAREYIKEDVK
ncbi:MAG: hypothetical protein J6S67_26480 [Methanobrevibacter sp.]|nr:hypothetical protein [Methanobrevibacter sp.]